MMEASSRLLMRFLVQLSYLMAAVSAVVSSHDVLSEFTADFAELSITSPKNGSQVLPNVMFGADLVVIDHKKFAKNHGANSDMCLVLDGGTADCHPVDAPSIMLENLAQGPHVLQAYVQTRDTTAQLLTPMASSYFTVSGWWEEGGGAAAAAAAVGAQQEELDPATAAAERAEEAALLRWYLRRAGIANTKEEYHSSLQTLEEEDEVAELSRKRSQVCQIGHSPCLLAIGVKTSVLSFEARQALRRTWLTHPLVASAEGPGRRVCAWGPAAAAVAAALGLEQALHGDLLLPPALDVEDGYLGLVEKTKGFLAAAAGPDPDRPPFQFAMLLDDDAYLDVAELVGALAGTPPHRVYAGQVWEEQLGRPLRPQRNPHHRNYLPEAAWAADRLPPFAVGPHYLLSRDLAAFVARNRRRLQGIGTLEDVTMGVWMMALGMAPQHVDHFITVKDSGCLPGAVSLADLTPWALHQVHANRAAGREPCAGFYAAPGAAGNENGGRPPSSGGGGGGGGWVRPSRAGRKEAPHARVARLAPLLSVEVAEGSMENEEEEGAGTGLEGNLEKGLPAVTFVIKTRLLLQAEDNSVMDEDGEQVKDETECLICIRHIKTAEDVTNAGDDLWWLAPTLQRGHHEKGHQVCGFPEVFPLNVLIQKMTDDTAHATAETPTTQLFLEVAAFSTKDLPTPYQGGEGRNFTISLPMLLDRGESLLLTEFQDEVGGLQFSFSSFPGAKPSCSPLPSPATATASFLNENRNIFVNPEGEVMDPEGPEDSVAFKSDDDTRTRDYVQHCSNSSSFRHSKYHIITSSFKSSSLLLLDRKVIRIEYTFPSSFDDVIGVTKK